MLPVSPLLGDRIEALETALAGLGPRELRAPAPVLRALGIGARFGAALPECGPAAPCGCAKAPATARVGPQKDH